MIETEMGERERKRERSDSDNFKSHQRDCKGKEGNKCLTNGMLADGLGDR